MTAEPPPASPCSSATIQEASRILDALTAQFGDRRSPKSEIHLSIVIPAYNEQRRLPGTVSDTIAWGAKYPEEYEIIIVDDGSADETLALAQLFSSRIENVRFISCPHQGKGAAVRTGMLNACGELVLFMDADGATSLGEIEKLGHYIEEGADIAIGSRAAHSPDDVVVVTKLHRKIIGRFFAALVSLFAISGFADTQCGFKMFHRRIVREVFSRQKLDGFAFDVEILHIAKNLGLKVVEVPVNWEDRKGSKVNLAQDSLRMLVDILKIRWLHK